MKKIKLTDNLSISSLVQGHWRLLDWALTSKELLALTEQSIELGVTTFDQADIYGNYGCEKAFGKVLASKSELRKDIELITKCGIKLISDKFPDRKVKHYDYSASYIISSVENSLENLHTDYIDLLLLHRPAPFFNPEEVAKAFSHLKQSGKVLNFGVSNFNPLQYEMLNSYLDDKLVTNQVEISPYCLDNFKNGTMDFFLKERIKPMAWSPLAGGELLNPTGEKGKRLANVLAQVASELGVEHIDQVIYCWLLMHPTGIIPVLGTGKIERIKQAVEALNIKMSIEQWYKIYTSSTGQEVP